VTAILDGASRKTGTRPVRENCCVNFSANGMKSLLSEFKCHPDIFSAFVPCRWRMFLFFLLKYMNSRNKICKNMSSVCINSNFLMGQNSCRQGIKKFPTFYGTRTYFARTFHWNIIYDMIYLLTAIGLSPGGSSTVHIYTQIVYRTIQNKQYIEQHNNLGTVRAVPRLG
jgi:hypothetical protein